MTPYRFDKTEKLELAATEGLIYIETIYAVENDDGYIMPAYNTENEAIDEAENIGNETGVGCSIAYIKVYTNLNGDYSFFKKI